VKIEDTKRSRKFQRTNIVAVKIRDKIVVPLCLCYNGIPPSPLLWNGLEHCSSNPFRRASRQSWTMYLFTLNQEGDMAPISALATGRAATECAPHVFVPGDGDCPPQAAPSGQQGAKSKARGHRGVIQERGKHDDRKAMIFCIINADECCGIAARHAGVNL
jgi:hypothetical protein